MHVVLTAHRKARIVLRTQSRTRTYHHRLLTDDQTDGRAQQLPDAPKASAKGPLHLHMAIFRSHRVRRGTEYGDWGNGITDKGGTVGRMEQTGKLGKGERPGMEEGELQIKTNYLDRKLPLLLS